MTESTPSLQEIYLSACKSFDELTNHLLQGFSSAVDSALMSYSEQQAEALQRSSGAISSQEREISSNLKDSLDALNQSVEQTMSENERFLDHVKEELLINCKSLQQEIADLSDSLMRSHNISSKVLLAKLSGQCDKSIDGVQQSAGRAKHLLKEQSHATSSQFSESLVEKQTRQFADLMAYENQARKEIPDMLSAIVSRGRLHEPKLQMINRQHNDQIDARIDQLRLKISEVSDSELSRIVTASGATEQKIRRSYEEKRSKLLSNTESLTRSFIKELEEASNNSRLETVELASSLRSEMMDLLTKSGSLESDRSKENSDRAKELSEELQSLIEDQRLIAAQKSTVIAKIMEEMREIESNFQKKVEKMSAVQLGLLSKTHEAAIGNISSTRKEVASKIQHLADKYMQQIEEEEERILKIIDRRLDKALGFIDQAIDDED